jgi:CheY-like chemotaxis protein
MEEFENCKLLVVEDNWETKLLVERLLKPLCFVKTVSTFDEALEIFPQDDFNIALIDVNLGEKRTGTELLHTLRTMPNNESIYSIA